jgi:hypothetical protein
MSGGSSLWNWRPPQPTGSPRRVATRNSPSGDARGAAQRCVEPGVEPAIDLGEVGGQALLGRGLGRVHGLDVDKGGGEQPLDVGHGGDQPGALGLAERRKEQPCQFVAAPIEHAALGRARLREASGADAPVALVRAHVDESRRFQRAQQAAEVAAVELEPGPQRAHVAAPVTDLPEHPCLAEGTGAGEVVVLEGAHPLGDEPVEPAHLGHHGVAHSLTNVRE